MLAKWTIEAERFEREANSHDIDFLCNLAKDAQRAYAATQEDDQTIFVLPQFASQLASAHAPVAREARDEDGIQANALSDELLKQWQTLKQRIQVIFFVSKKLRNKTFEKQTRFIYSIIFFFVNYHSTRFLFS